MATIGDVGRWIAENESLLSGLAAMIAVAGMPELRNDPRFPRLCARLGLVEFWIATGKWPDCADEVPYNFKAECAKAQHIPKEHSGIWAAGQVSSTP